MTRNVWTTGRRALLVNLVSLTTLIVIGWIDYITGYELGFFIFYFIPVSIAAWFVSRRAGLVMACASALTWYLSDRFTHHPYSKAYLIYWEMWMRFVSFITTALTVAKIRASLEREKELNTELTRAFREIEELKCVLPECAACSRLRDTPAGRQQFSPPPAEREMKEESASRPEKRDEGKAE